MILSRSVVRSAQHGVMVKVSQRRPNPFLSSLVRHQRNEDADRQIETGIRLDADMAHNWSSESRVCVSLKMTERRHIKPRLILVSSAHGTGRQSLSLQHSFGYQECAPAALLISCATTNKQTSFPISALKCPDPSKCMREDAIPMLPT